MSPRVRGVLGLLILLLFVAGIGIRFFKKPKSEILPPSLPKLTQPQSPLIEAPTDSQKKLALEKEFFALMEKKSDAGSQTVKIPSPSLAPKPLPAATIPKRPAPKTEKERRRRERESLPLGVVLFDDVQVYTSSTKKVAYKMQTGDFVRVFNDNPSGRLIKVQPGVDVYLAATSKQFEAAGNRFPDNAVRISPSDLHIFNPKQALEFTQGTEPMTLGNDPRFSTVDFYERAMKNPDPVVHRVVGPRIIALLSLHDDYNLTWRTLYRDHDSKIRSLTLATLRKRGVGNNRELIEDLIKRLAELTKVRVRGESEAEVLAILSILAQTKHPRVPVALQGFAETWKNTQGKAINDRVETILKEDINNLFGKFKPMILLQIIIATFLIGLISFVGLLFFGLKVNVRKVTFYLISLASGTMLGVAFIHLIPQSVKLDSHHTFLNIALGVFFFFIMEKFLIWRHCHHHQRPEDHSRPVAARMILIGDAAHNFIDGIIIAGAFLTSPTVGISVTLAIMLHEIPQELGDFGVLIHGGLKVRRALIYNALTASASILGGVFAYLSFGASGSFQALILPVAAGGFLYIALADLIPQLHEQVATKQSVIQIVLLAAGFGVILLTHSH